MNTLKIEIPKGYEIDKQKSTFENIVFKRGKKELPKSWEKLGKIKGYYVDQFSKIHELIIVQSYVDIDDKNTFATKEQAEASIALAQLSQLREVYRNGWVPNWSDNHEKYCILIIEDAIITDRSKRSNRFLSFQDAETRGLFLENFRDLIEKAKPLMS